VNFCKIRVVDILQSGADIIVLSANPSLLAGSGISGVIHKAAGEELDCLTAIYRVIIGPVGSIINLHTQIHTHKFWLALFCYIALHKSSGWWCAERNTHDSKRLLYVV
jgi:hypothetical protein